MKTLKISLLIALFFTLSSPSNMSISENTIKMEANFKDDVSSSSNFFVHSRDKIRLPSQS